MSMITQCPSCGTTFRVTPIQLQAQRGLVRCGRCATVFDGFKALAALRDESPLETAPAVTAAARREPEPAATPAPVPRVAPDRALAHASDGTPQAVADAFLAPTAVATPVVPISSEPAVPIQSQSYNRETINAAVLEPNPPAPVPPPFTPEPAISVPQPSPAPEPIHPEPARDARETVAPLELKSPEAPASHPTNYAPPLAAAALPRRHNGVWAFAIVILLFALAIQAAYFLRGEIAARIPELRPHLNKICEALHCTVALPQSPRQLSIEASDMQATDPANPGQIVLTATLRNQAANVIGYPALDVVLTNVKEHTVARRIFMPADYLDSGKDPRAGIQPSAEVTVRLSLETGDLGAAGFRLDLLPAPVR